MTNKIMFWLDGEVTHYCLAYYMQQKIDSKFYAVFDVTNHPKNFFKNQKLVSFENFWFYHDFIHELDKKPDLEYLSAIEKKFNLNLWEMACNDRMFYLYNDYHKFTSNEILRILELECRNFEKILDEVQPDFLITPETALRPHSLFHKMCKSRGIHILMLNHANFENYCYISKDRHKMNFIDDFNNIKSDNLTLDDLLNRLKSFQLSNHLTNYYKQQKNSISDKIKAAIQFLFISSNDNIKTHYTYFGRKKLRVLIKEIIFSLKRRYREFFINNNFSKNTYFETPIIFLPLHQEPERSLLIAAPFFTNQIETIRHVAKSIPMGHTLVVKEHPSQGPARGWRQISDYKDMLDIPNTIFLHPSISSEEIIQKSSLVISVGGTSSFEAAFYGKPSIIFADMDYALLPSVSRLKSLNELPNLISESLSLKIDPSFLEKYIKILEKNSFEFNYLDFKIQYHNYFYLGGNLIDVDITSEQMLSFLEIHRNTLQNLVSEHIKKLDEITKLRKL